MKDSSSGSEEKLSLNPVPLWPIITLVIMHVIAAVVIYAFWDMIPDPFPSHWSGGEPDSYTDKSVGAVAMVVGFGSVLVSVVLLVAMYGTHATNAQALKNTPGLYDDSVQVDPERRKAQTNRFIPDLAIYLVGVAALMLANTVTSVLGVADFTGGSRLLWGHCPFGVVGWAF